MTGNPKWERGTKTFSEDLDGEKGIRVENSLRKESDFEKRVQTGNGSKNRVEPVHAIRAAEK
jgi:hypothetical protein